MARSKVRIRKGDTVKVIAGKSRGSVGRVISVLPEAGRVVVEGVQRVKRHQKPVGDQPGSIIEKEASIHVSNVALWNEEEARVVRVTYRVGEDGRKIRVDRRTGTPLDKK